MSDPNRDSSSASLRISNLTAASPGSSSVRIANPSFEASGVTSRSGHNSAAANSSTASRQPFGLAASGRASEDSVSFGRSFASVATSQKTLNFFRRIVGQRGDDYHEDLHQVSTATYRGSSQREQQGQPATASMMRISSVGNSSRSMTGMEQQGGGTGSRWFRWLCCCLWPCFSWPPDSRRQFFARIIYSRLWRALLILFTIVLLFGASIRDLWIPPGGDTAMDAVFMIAFCTFTIDIFMRADVEPNYFAFSIPGCNRLNKRAASQEQQREQLSSAAAVGGCGCGSCRLGSFLFWCDVISTLTLLHEISFIDKKNFDEQHINITLDRFGFPKDGLESVNAASPVELEVSLFVTIAKTARMARFIRSSTAVKISAKVNWYGILNLFNPCWWIERCTSSRERKEVNRSGMSTEDTFRGSLGLSGRSGTGTDVTKSLVRRQSWGGIGLGALAAVKAQQTSDSEPKPGALKAVTSGALRFLGLLPHDNEMWRRQIAATKIQRAWRSFIQRAEDEDSNFDGYNGSEDAWQGRMSASNPMEKALQKRSFLMRYSTMNTKNIKKSRGGDISHRSGNEENIREVGSGRSRIPLGASHPAAKRRSESQVGSAMRELTGQRVAIGIIVALVLTVLFTYTELDATRPSTMIVLYNQTANEQFAYKALDAARASSVPDLYEYTFADGEVVEFTLTNGEGDPVNLRDREKLRITVTGQVNTTIGYFAQRQEVKEEALVELLSTIFILLVWFFGVTAFAGPVMVLVVIPIERMVRLLGMLMLDPLGYESTSRYRRFEREEAEITKNTKWTKEVLKGMETSFLMSTILRIGSLLKVGFGSAGVEIIRKSLERGQSKNMLVLSSQGSTVSCIFLFCDIRQFTDATECLQEEVFVFTNRVAAVVHSICHSYGGSANKNVGDAFLLSWLLDEEANTSIASGDGFRRRSAGDTFVAKNNQADKALLTVVKICMALQYDDYYTEPLSDGARDALKAKLAKRKGPVVQMGFGLHAGKAVQGAIGSQRKIDATYVSEAVERAEFLESSTKQYGVKMLMSDNFHRLLHPNNRRRCRKVDQILIRNEDDDDDEDEMQGDVMELLTFDMDIEALWKNGSKGSKSDTGHESDSEPSSKDGPSVPRMPSATRQTSGGLLKGPRRRSLRFAKGDGSDELSEHNFAPAIPPSGQQEMVDSDGAGNRKLILPTGTAFYNANVWVSEDMRKIRQLYSDGIFFEKFNSGLKSFYAKDWDHAKQCFTTILERFEDGPSRYFMNQMEKYKGKPPRDFLPYGIA